MVVLWLMDAAIFLLASFLSLFDFLPELTLPEPLAIVVPVAVLSAGGIASLNSFLPVAMAVAGALALGKMLQWLYDRFPFKAT